MLKTYEFQILDNVDWHLLILKNARDNCAIALELSEDTGVGFRLNKQKQEEQLEALRAVKTGSGSMVNLVVCVSIEPVDCYRVNAQLFGTQIAFEAVLDSCHDTDLDYPLFILPARTFDKVEFDFVHKKAVLTVQSEKLSAFFEKQTEEARNFMKNSVWN